MFKESTSKVYKGNKSDIILYNVFLKLIKSRLFTFLHLLFANVLFVIPSKKVLSVKWNNFPLTGGDYDKKVDDGENNHADTHREKDVDTLVVSAFLFMTL